MQRDFHYYAIGVLARAAGFSPRDSLTIAYASQYVDDSTESELVRLAIGDTVLNFDPVRTAYGGLRQLGALSWSAQKRIYIPFHFIPPKPFRPKKEVDFSFVTVPATGTGIAAADSFSETLIRRAERESLRNRKRRLCRIGIALHTYADTWAHQGFSGRYDQTENDVDNIHLYNRAKDKYEYPRLENIVLEMLPQLGHAQAGFFPDLAFQKWRYNSKQEFLAIERDNTQEFLIAAKSIHKRLTAIKKTKPSPPIPWEEIEPDFRKLFYSEPAVPAEPSDHLSTESYQKYRSSELEARCKEWRQKFEHLFQPYPPHDSYNYDKKRWRELAMKGDIDWDEWSVEDWGEMVPMGVRPDFWDSLWVNFHRAALLQRHYVLENLP